MPRRTVVDPQFPTRLREVRLARGLSQQELARAACMSRSHISELESGIKTPGVAIARALDNALGTTGELAQMVADPTPAAGRNNGRNARGARRTVVDPRFPSRLRELRLARGLSIRELARRVPCTHVHIIGMEKGANVPSPSMAARLDKVLGVADLGRLVTNLVSPAIEPVATGGEVEVDETNRRQTLTTAFGLTGTAAVDTPEPLMLGAGVLSLLGSLPPDPDAMEGGQGAEVAAYGELSRRLWRMYWDAPALALFEAAYAQVRMGMALLGGVSGVDRYRVTGALATSALLVARLAFFDLNRPGATTRCHQVALAAASEAGDHSMVAAVLGHMAFGPAFAGESEQAGELTAMALASAKRTSSLVRSWLHCVASEAEARSGNGSASLRQIELAEDTFTADEPVPEWFDFYDHGRLGCFAGYAAAAAGEHTLAADRLSHALAELGPNGSKQRSVVCADLAIACQDDVDRVAHHLNEAIDALETSWYEVGHDRVREARTLLGDSRLGRQVDQRLAILPGGRR